MADRVMAVLVFRPRKLRLPLLAPKVSTPPNELVEVDRSMPLPLPTVKVALPVVVMAPLCVMLPAVVTFSVVALLVPKTKLLVSCSVATLALVMLTLLKSLPALFSVMLLALPATSVAASAETMDELPPWLMPAPVSETGPWAVRLPFSTSAPVAFRFTRSWEPIWPA